ncbi:MAG: type II toxin-antitoxin system HicA family toxin [Pseudomonadota bacterium]
MSKKPLKFRELIEKLKPYGIVHMSKRGKGSEVILLKPDIPGAKRGLQYPIKHHGDGTELSIPVINALLRRFEINPESFWA